jgi:hypothetical protein
MWLMEAVSITETSASFYESTRRNIPEDSHLHTRSRKNLKSHIHAACHRGLLSKLQGRMAVQATCSYCTCPQFEFIYIYILRMYTC